MIKTNDQLIRIEERIQQLKDELRSLANEYSGLEYEFYSDPVAKEISDLGNQILEYRTLRDLPFETSINEVLKTPVLLEKISLLLTKLRIASKQTQAELAKKLGWQQSNLSRFENENNSSQTISKISEYAAAIGVSLYVMVTDCTNTTEYKYYFLEKDIFSRKPQASEVTWSVNPHEPRQFPFERSTTLKVESQCLDTV